MYGQGEYVNSSPALFNQHRSRLFGLSYRMLGSRADAEDILQEAYIRWLRADISELRSPEAWLVTVVTRLSIDLLRLVRKERENYIGQWLPEPWVTEYECSAEQSLELAGDLSLAFLAVLERLAPEERAVFLLHDIFEFSYPDIAQMLGKSQANCRQMIHRARLRVRQDRPRFSVDRETHLLLLEKFIEATRTGDRDQLKALFADDITLTSDGGGKVMSVRKILHGPERVSRLYHAIKRMLDGRMTFRIAGINGTPGLLRYVDGMLDAATSVITDGKYVREILHVRNPDKLALITLRTLP